MLYGVGGDVESHYDQEEAGQKGVGGREQET